LIAVVAPSAPIAAADPVCDLGNGIEHVVSITFDNVHFFRDNPNVESDLEQMPTLNDFIPDNGVVALHIAVDPASVNDLLVTVEPIASEPSQPGEPAWKAA